MKDSLASLSSALFKTRAKNCSFNSAIASSLMVLPLVVVDVMPPLAIGSLFGAGVGFVSGNPLAKMAGLGEGKGLKDAMGAKGGNGGGGGTEAFGLGLVMGGCTFGFGCGFTALPFLDMAPDLGADFLRGRRLVFLDFGLGLAFDLGVVFFVLGLAFGLVLT